MLNTKIDELYPEHDMALKKAELAPDVFPKMKSIKEKLESTTRKKSCENRKIKVSRQTYYCIGVCDAWKRKDAIHLTLNKLRKA